LLSIATASSILLSDQFRQRAVFADEVLRAAGEVGELCGGGVNSEPLIERGEDVSEMNWPGSPPQFR
jgi:hypothetical protein